MVRVLFFTIGTLSLVLSIIGVFLPLLPTTPLVILAAVCFSKSSKTMHRWLKNNRIFGPTIRDWEESRTIPLRAKIVSIVFLNFSLIISGSFFIEKPVVLVLLAAIGISVSLLIYRIPTSELSTKNESPDS